MCLDMFWIYFIFNDRLTLIPHISGLSTQWQVHMVCFSEIHPNSTSQPHVFIRSRFFPPQGSASWSGAGLGLSGISDGVFRCQGPLWSSPEHHTSPARQNQMLFLQSICPPDAFLFTCVSRCSLSSVYSPAMRKLQRWKLLLLPSRGAAAVLPQPADTSEGIQGKVKIQKEI